MEPSEAVDFIGSAVTGRQGIWADFGAGDGTFTRALVKLLGPDSTIYAVDRDGRSLAALKTWAAPAAAKVIPVLADFTAEFELPGLSGASLDGILCANALHFIPDPGYVLVRLAARLKPGGRFVLVEYDRRPPSRWVPHPVVPEMLPKLAAAAGLTAPVITATRRSEYGGALYVAAADRVP